jgi:hypothetical protein
MSRINSGEGDPNGSFYLSDCRLLLIYQRDVTTRHSLLRARALKLIKMLRQRLADGTARKSSIENRSDEKNYAQRSHDQGEVMQAVVGRMLTVHDGKKTGRSHRADISRRTLQTRGGADLSRRRLEVNRCLGSGGR